jgi:hypothetical protein
MLIHSLASFPALCLPLLCPLCRFPLSNGLAYGPICAHDTRHVSCPRSRAASASQPVARRPRPTRAADVLQVARGGRAAGSSGPACAGGGGRTAGREPDGAAARRSSAGGFREAIRRGRDGGHGLQLRRRGPRRARPRRLGTGPACHGHSCC